MTVEYVAEAQKEEHDAEEDFQDGNDLGAGSSVGLWANHDENFWELIKSNQQVFALKFAWNWEEKMELNLS